jgi:hypothetical protein
MSRRTLRSDWVVATKTVEPAIASAWTFWEAGRRASSEDAGAGLPTASAAAIKPAASESTIAEL